MLGSNMWTTTALVDALKVLIHTEIDFPVITDIVYF